MSGLLEDGEPPRLLGVDIGGTKIAVAVVDAASGSVLARRVVPTPARSGVTGVIEAAADVAARVLAAYPAVAGGVGAPGIIDVERGVVVVSTGALGRSWEGTAVAPELERRLGLPFAADNDVNAGALGEARWGAGRSLGSFLFVGIGAGLGGAVVRDGRVVRGATGTAGEIGHVPVFGADDVMCSCGRPAHLEAVVCSRAITAAYQRATGEQGVDLRVVARRAAAGEAAARAVLENVGTVLGRTLGGLVNVLDPEAVILGGGVMQAGEPLWSPLQAALHAEVLPSVADIPLRPAALGVDAGVIGAAALAVDLVAPAASAAAPLAATPSRASGGA